MLDKPFFFLKCFEQRRCNVKGKTFSVWEKWLSLGLAVLIISLPVMADQIVARTEEQRQAITEAEKQAEMDANKWTFFVLGLIGTAVTLLIVNFIEPKPPQSSLLGKSQEYVAAYTDAYVRKVKNIRLNYTLYGCLTGTATWVIFYALVIAAAVSETETYY
ncbi:MAG: hypothetical protein AB1410_03675 [Acidobacteriota bacterium]